MQKSLAELRAQAKEAHGEALEITLDDGQVLTFRAVTSLRPARLAKVQVDLKSKKPEVQLAAVEELLRSTLAPADRSAFDTADLGLADLMAILGEWAELQGTDAGNS